MKKSKLLMAVLCAAAVLTAGSVAGCGQQEEPVSMDETQELNWFSDLSWWSPKTWDVDSASGTGKITEKTGVKIRYSIPDDNADTRLSLMMINGNMPDIISVSDEQMIRHLINSEAVWNMQELLEEYLPDSHLLTDYPEDVKNTLIARDGDWYGLASDLHSEDNATVYGELSEFYQEIQEKGQSIGIIWNKMLLKRLGYEADELQTEEMVLQIFQEVKEREVTVNAEAVIPLLIDGKRYTETTLPFLEDTFGASYLDETGNYRERIATDQGRHALKFLNTLFRLDYADYQQTIMTAYNVKRTLNSGQVLCFIGDIENSGINPDEWVSSGAIFSADGSEPFIGKTTQVSCGTATTFVSKNCKNPAAVAGFLDYMTTEEGMNAYLEKSESWWPLRNEDWYYSVLDDGDEKMISWKEILCKYYDTPGMREYDKDGLGIMTETGELRDIQAQIRDSFSQGVNTALWAETDEEFEAAWKELLEDMEEAGLSKLEAARTERIHQK